VSRVTGLILDLSCAGFIAVVDAEDKPLALGWRAPGARYDDAGAWIEDCLRKAGGGFPDLKWIGAGVGPGSFTGIRIAMAFAQGLAMPREIPLHGFTTFSALFLACEPEPGKRRVAAIPANSGRFYVASDADSTGTLMESEELLHMASPDTTLIVPGKTPAMEMILPSFNHVCIVEDRWEVSHLARHARISGLDARQPYYLQRSAAEEKARF
jgi:tRNA threonylcarbamoyladenosine biosynthesis protein TsaB